MTIEIRANRKLRNAHPDMAPGRYHVTKSGDVMQAAWQSQADVKWRKKWRRAED
jgi:hypothetical protein